MSSAHDPPPPPEELLDRHLQGDQPLDAPAMAEVSAALAASAHLRRQFAERLLLEADLAGALRGDAPRVPVAPRWPTRMRWGLALGAAAAGLLVVLLGGRLLQLRQGPDRSCGVVTAGSLRDPHGRQVRAVQPGTAYTAVAEGATLATAAGDVYTCTGGAQVQWSTGTGGQDTTLLGGGIAITARHRERAPLVVHAGPADVLVVGTRFRVALEGGSAAVGVDAGVVRVQRVGDHPQEVLVHAGEGVHVAAGNPTALVVEVVPLAGGHHYHVGPGGTFPTLASLPRLGAGDVVECDAALERGASHVDADGTAEAPVRIIGHRTELDGTGVACDGQNAPRAVLELSGNHIRVAGFHVRQAHNAEGNAGGIRVLAGDDVLVSDCDIRGCDCGVLVHASGAVRLTHLLVDGNGIRGPTCLYGNIAIEGCRALEMEQCLIAHAHLGDDLRVAAATATIADCAIVDGDAGAGCIVLSAPEAAANAPPAVVRIESCVIRRADRGEGNRTRLIAAETPDRLAITLVHDTCITAIPGVSLVDDARGQGRGTLAVDACVLDGPFARVDAGGMALRGAGNWISSACAVPATLAALRGADAHLDAAGRPLPGSPILDAASLVAAAGQPRQQPVALPDGQPWPPGVPALPGACAPAP